MRNSLTELMFSVLNKGESIGIHSTKSSSFSKQLKEVVGSKELREMDVVGVLDQQEMDFTCHDTELRESVVHLFGRLHHESSFACMKELNDLLKVNLMCKYFFNCYFCNLDTFFNLFSTILNRLWGVFFLVNK